MEVVYSSSDSYVGVMAISIVSLLENNVDADDINIHVISNGISDEKAESLRKLVERYGRRIKLVPLPDLNAMLSLEIDFKQHNIATYARLFLSQILPDLHRVIFIDCDTIVVGSLDDLWRMELREGVVCAGVKDAISRFNKARIGLSSDATYVNAGVLLFDLDNWKRARAFEKCVEFLRERKGSVPLVDQGVLNGCLSESIEPISMKYNVMTYAYVFSYKELLRYKKPCSNYYTQREFEAAVCKPLILHSTGNFLMDRAWHANSAHPYASEWHRYALVAGDISEFGEASPSSRDVALRWLCATPLRRIVLEALGIVQATVKG